MNSIQQPFNFSANFGFGDDSVFTDINLAGSTILPPPPEPGYFLELQTGPFILLNGQDMVLL